MPSSTEENYLKAIFRHSAGAGAGTRVSLGKIAQDLSVSPGTVTTMMKQLAARDLVTYRSRQGVELTGSGKQAALDILRRHRLIELFLVEIMGMDWADVHTEAEVLEHVVSERLIDRMDEMLGRPARDPHGAPIPDADGQVDEHDAAPLADCPPGRYRVAQVDEASPAFLGWLAGHGLVPGAVLTVRESDRLAGTLTLDCPDGRQGVSLGLAAAHQIHVTVEA